MYESVVNPLLVGRNRRQATPSMVVAVVLPLKASSTWRRPASVLVPPRVTDTDRAPAKLVPTTSAAKGTAWPSTSAVSTTVEPTAGEAWAAWAGWAGWAALGITRSSACRLSDVSGHAARPADGVGAPGAAAWPAGALAGGVTTNETCRRSAGASGTVVNGGATCHPAGACRLTLTLVEPAWLLTDSSSTGVGWPAATTARWGKTTTRSARCWRTRASRV